MHKGVIMGIIGFTLGLLSSISVFILLSTADEENNKETSNNDCSFPPY
jgi:hypothetical protein